MVVAEGGDERGGAAEVGSDQKAFSEEEEGFFVSRSRKVEGEEKSSFSLGQLVLHNTTAAS